MATDDFNGRAKQVEPVKENLYRHAYATTPLEKYKLDHPPCVIGSCYSNCPACAYEAGKAAKTPTVEAIAKEIHKGLDEAFGMHETGWSSESWDRIPEDWCNKYRVVASAILALFKGE
jgi:hypothetical protein